MRLPSAQGAEIGLEDFRGKKNVIVWFTKGMACMFCRAQMSQLSRAYGDLQKLDAEILQVSISGVSRAQVYAKKFKLPFPYLCDPDYLVRRQWGLGRREHGLGHYVRGLIHGATAEKPPNDFGDFLPPLDEMRNLLNDDDMGFFIVDKRGRGPVLARGLVHPRRQGPAAPEQRGDPSRGREVRNAWERRAGRPRGRLMSGLVVGQPAPAFRLPSAQGPEIAIEDFRGKRNVVVWFTKGMACPFCRSHMSQLARAYREFQQLGAEVLEITLSSVKRARLYAQKFNIPFPYLCDPDYRVRRQWMLGDRRHGPAWYARLFLRTSKLEPPPNDFGEVKVSAGEILTDLYDDDMGFFIVDKQGVVRYALAGAYGDLETLRVRPIPSNDELLRELHNMAA